MMGNEITGKADAAQFRGKRKLLLIPYVMQLEAEEELEVLVEQYWSEAVAQIQKLEASLGSTRYLFHEGVLGIDGTPESVITRANPAGAVALGKLLNAGATLVATEDHEILAETLDLHRCLSVIQISQVVAQRLTEWFEDCRQRRYAHIATRINATLNLGESAAIVLAPDHRVQFDSDIEVVYIAPPSLDRINRWMRERSSRESNPIEQTEDSSSGQNPG